MEVKIRNYLKSSLLPGCIEGCVCLCVVHLCLTGPLIFDGNDQNSASCIKYFRVSNLLCSMTCKETVRRGSLFMEKIVVHFALTDVLNPSLQYEISYGKLESRNWS